MSLFEQKKDYSSEFQILSESFSNVKDDGFDDYIASLFSLEKKCRLGADHTNHKKVSLLIVEACRQKNNWAKLNSSLVLINKRCVQEKLTVTAVVTEAMTYIEVTPNLETKLELLNTLKDICDGKMYVEKESAHLHFMLSKIYEGQGDVAKACDTIQDVHVETYGSLSKVEKATYILEQIRLNLLRKDYVRAAIHSSKMNRKTLEEKGFTEVKIRFYTMQIEYFMVEKNAWEICQAYYKIAEILLPPAPVVEAPSKPSGESKESKETKASEEKKKKEKGEGQAMDVAEEELTLSPADLAAKFGVGPEVMESAVIFLLLSKFDNHQSDMLHRVKKLLSAEIKKVELRDDYLHALTLFTTHEVIPPRFAGQDLLENHPSLSKIAHFEVDTRAHFIAQLKDRVVEHNLRVVAKYYKRIRTARLSELICVGQDDLETYLSEISSRGDLNVKIDRPAGIITFHEKKSAESVLSEWASDMGKMMNLMEATCHLINRENMVHKI